MKRKKLLFTFLIFSFLTPPLAFSTPSKEDHIVSVLKLPFLNRMKVLKKQKTEAHFEALEKIAMNSNQSLQLRWKAVNTLALIYKKKSLPVLEKALRQKEWFMKNAGLTGLSYVDPKKTRFWALKLLKDPALVVRTVAVDMLGIYGLPGDKEVLKAVLNDSQNFRGSQSLWVRKHVTRSLARLAILEDAPYFAKLLRDKDERVQAEALVALKKIYKKNLTSPRDSLAVRKQKWQNWLSRRSSSQTSF